MKLDTLEVERLRSNLQDCKRKELEAQHQLNHLIQNRINEVVGIIVDTLGYTAYDAKGDMLYEFRFRCYCRNCGGEDIEDDYCLLNELESSADYGNYTLTAIKPAKWNSLLIGRHDYKRDGIPKEFLYMDDNDIKAQLGKEMLASKSTQEKRKKTMEAKKQEKEKAKKSALAKLTDYERKLLGIKQ